MSFVTDVVKEWMRTNAAALTEQAVVVKANDRFTPKGVRDSLKELREAGVLAHSIEGGKVSYMWAPQLPPARQPETAMKPVGAKAEQILQAMRTGGQTEYRVVEIMKLANVKEKTARYHLQAMVNNRKVFAAGKTVSRRYSLEPIKVETVPDPFIKGAAIAMEEVGVARGATWAPGVSEGVEHLVKEMQGAQNQEPPGATRRSWRPGDGLLPIVDGPEPQVAITADGDLLILDGAEKTTLPPRTTRAIARLVLKLHEGGLIHG